MQARATVLSHTHTLVILDFQFYNYFMCCAVTIALTLSAPFPSISMFLHLFIALCIVFSLFRTEVMNVCVWFVIENVVFRTASVREERKGEGGWVFVQLSWGSLQLWLFKWLSLCAVVSRAMKIFKLFFPLLTTAIESSLFFRIMPSGHLSICLQQCMCVWHVTRLQWMAKQIFGHIKS